MVEASFLIINTFSTPYIPQLTPTLWITYHQCMILTMNRTMLYIITVLLLDSNLNSNVLTILEIDPSLRTEFALFPFDIIINLWDVLIHKNALINGLRFSCMAEYGVVSLSSTLSPCLEELIGA